MRIPISKMFHGKHKCIYIFLNIWGSCLADACSGFSGPILRHWLISNIYNRVRAGHQRCQKKAIYFQVCTGGSFWFMDYIRCLNFDEWSIYWHCKMLSIGLSLEYWRALFHSHKVMIGFGFRMCSLEVLLWYGATLNDIKVIIVPTQGI